jgi:hypothetical protein
VIDEHRRSGGQHAACQTTDVLQACGTSWKRATKAAPAPCSTRAAADQLEAVWRRAYKGYVSARVIATGLPGARELDEWDRLELDAILADVAPLMEIYTP